MFLRVSKKLDNVIFMECKLLVAIANLGGT